MADSSPFGAFNVFRIGGATRNSTFPPGLNTLSSPADLDAATTPDSFGFDLDKTGRISSGTVPDGLAQVLQTVDISDISYYWIYNRLWNYDGLASGSSSSEDESSSDEFESGTTTLYYGARFYGDTFVEQRLSKEIFNEDGGAIRALIPFGQSNIMVIKTTGSYVLSGCSSPTGPFGKSDIIQEIRCNSVLGAIEVNGVVYASNGSGLFAYGGGKVTEVSKSVRNSTTVFKDCELTASYDKRYVIGNGRYVYEIETGKIFDYDSTNFRYTSPQFHAPNYNSMTVQSLYFVVQHTDTSEASLKYQIRRDNNVWKEEQTVKIPFDNENYTVVKEDLENAFNSFLFQIRITEISDNLEIREIKTDSQSFSADTYVI